MTVLSMSGGALRAPAPLAGFIILYVLLYSAFGVASPFLPSFIEARGIPLEQIGMLFAAGTAIRLVSAPLAGRLADRTGSETYTCGLRAGNSHSRPGIPTSMGFLANFGAEPPSCICIGAHHQSGRCTRHGRVESTFWKISNTAGCAAPARPLSFSGRCCPDWQ